MAEDPHYVGALKRAEAAEARVAQLRKALLWSMSLDAGLRCPYCYDSELAGNDALCPAHQAMKDTAP